jgi:hypothetical protein
MTVERDENEMMSPKTDDNIKRLVSAVESKIMKKHILELRRKAELERIKTEEMQCEKCFKPQKECVCLKNRSLGFLTTRNKFRISVAHVVHHNYFDNSVLFMIFLSR